MRTSKDNGLLRLMAFLLCLALTFGNGSLMDSVSAFAEALENESEKYSASIVWRKEDNSGNAENPLVINEEESRREYIYMGVNIKNTSSTPVMPGELKLYLSGLGELKRGGTLNIVSDDPVFAENWELAGYNADADEYTLINKKPISKQVLTTLHWEVNSRDAVGLEDNGGDELESFKRTVTASYEVTRYKRDAEGQLLDEYGNIIDDDGLLRDSSGTAYAAVINGVTYTIEPTDGNDPAYGYLVDANGLYLGTDGEALARITVDRSTGYQLDDNGYLINKNGNYIDKNGNASSVGVAGTPQTAYAVTDADGIVYSGGKPVTGTPQEGEAQSAEPVTVFTGDRTDTNSLEFEYTSKRDNVDIDVKGREVNAIEAEDLNDKYSWYSFDITVTQEKNARGVHDSDLFIELELPENVDVSEISVLDKNGNPVTVVTETVNGQERIGFYDFKNRKGDINSYRTNYRVGILKTEITGSAEDNILKFTGINRVLYNDENKSEYKSTTARADYENENSEIGTPISVPDYGNQFYDPANISFSKSNGKYENGDHTDPGNNASKKLLSGNLFTGQTITFKLTPSVMKSSRQAAPLSALVNARFTARRVTEIAHPGEAAEIPADTLYDLVVGDDTVGITYADGKGEPRLLDGSEYTIVNVVIPAGICHTSDAEDGVSYHEGDGYEYELFVSSDGGRNYTSAGTGFTSKTEAKTLSVNADAFYVVIKDLDKIVDGKIFTTAVRFKLSNDNAENDLLLRSDETFDEAAARVVNYGFMQMIYEKDGEYYDLAAGTGEFHNSVNGDSVIEDRVNESNRELEEGAYLRRSYSNVFLRTAVTFLSSNTEFRMPLTRGRHWDAGSTGSLDRWYGKVTTKGTITSDNPGPLRKFTIRADIPQYLELRDPSLSSLRDSLVFSGTDLFTKEVFDSSILTSENTTFELITNPDGSRTVKIDFDFSENPLLASAETSVAFSYDVYVEDENPALDRTKPFRVTSYTRLDDDGRKVVLASGNNRGSIYDSHTVKSSASSEIRTSDIALETELTKRVRTDLTNGLYLRNADVRGSTDTEASEYTYRLGVKLHHSDNSSVKEMVIFDKLERYRKDGNDDSGYNTRWQGELRRIDITEAYEALGRPSDVMLYYTTDENAYFTARSEGDIDYAADMVANLTAANGWKPMTSSDNKVWTVPSSETGDVRAFAAVLLTSSDNEVPMEADGDNGYKFNTHIDAVMKAPKVTDDKVNTMAVNAYDALVTVHVNSENNDNESGYFESNPTYVTMLNTLRIKKVDYNRRYKGLLGAEFEVLTDRNSSFTSVQDYRAHANTYAPSELELVEYTVFDESTYLYGKKTLRDLEVDPQGILTLSLAPDFYFLRETKTPVGYEGDLEIYYLIHFDYNGTATLLDTFLDADGDGVLEKCESGAELASGEDGVHGLISVFNKANAVGTAEFTKTDSDTGNALEGAEFRLLCYDDNDEPQPVGVEYDSTEKCYIYSESGNARIVSRSDGKIIIKNIPTGSYALEELSAPTGYTINNQATEFQVRLANIRRDGTIDLTATGQLANVSQIGNAQIRSELRLVKHDENESDAEKNLAGARYALYRLRARTEEDAETDDEEFLAAAKSEIYGWNGRSELSYWEKTAASMVTDVSGSGSLGGILFGTYFLYEELAPTGYKINNNRNNYISSDAAISEGIITVDPASASAHANAADRTFSVTHNDVRKKGKAQVQKLSAADESPLAGARFALLRKLGNTQNPPPDLLNYDPGADNSGFDTVIYHSGSYDFETDSDGWTRVIDNLDWGTYYFKEISAPAGYELSTETREFTISAKTASVTNRIFMNDDQKRGSVMLEKFEKDHHETKLAGAKFRLMEKLSDGSSRSCNVIRLSDGIYRIAEDGESGSTTELVTDAQGLINVSGLEWSLYEFVETVPPAGYATAVVESFSVDRESCGSVIYRMCEEPRAEATILLDKYLSGTEDYSAAFGAPTFIFRITEINNITDRIPVQDGMVYTKYMSFADGDTEGHASVSVAQSCYMIEEIGVSRYVFEKLETVAADTNISDYSPASGVSQTASAVAYCDLSGTADPQYRAAFTNGIRRFDKLSHVAVAQNRFPAANEYLTGMRASYDSYVPVYNRAGSRYRIPLEDITVSRINNKDEVTELTTAEKAALTYSGASGYSVSLVEEDGTYYLEVPNTRNYGLTSRRVTVSDGTHDTQLLIRYEGAKSDVKKYVTLMQDTDNLSYFGDDMDPAADVVFTKNADDGTISSDMSDPDKQLRTVDAGYRLKCWQYEDEDGHLTDLTFNSEEEIQDFIFSSENDGVTTFTFVAQLEYSPRTSAKFLVGSNNGFDNKSKNQNGADIKSRINWLCARDDDATYTSSLGLEQNGVRNGYPMDWRLASIQHCTESDYQRDLANGLVYREVYLSPAEGAADYDPEYPTPVKGYTVLDPATDMYTLYIFTEGKDSKILMPSNCFNLFLKVRKIRDLSGLEYWDTSQVTNMKQMFKDLALYSNTTADTPIDMTPIQNWDTSSVTDMEGMFYNSNSQRVYYTGFDLSNWDLSNVKKMNDMFRGSYNTHLSEIMFGGELTNVQTMQNIFSGVQGQVDAAALISTWKLKGSRLLTQGNTARSTGKTDIAGTYTTADGVTVTINSSGQMSFSNY